MDKFASIYETVLTKEYPGLSEDELGQMLYNIASRDEKKPLIAEMRTQLLNAGDHLIQHWMIYAKQNDSSIAYVFRR